MSDEEFNVNEQLLHQPDEDVSREREQEIEEVFGRKQRLFFADRDTKEVVATITFKDGSKYDLTAYDMLALGNSLAILVGGAVTMPELLGVLPTGDRAIQLLGWDQNGPTEQRVSQDMEVVRTNGIQLATLGKTLMGKFGE